MALLNRWAAPPGLDDLFVSRYAQLVVWAQQLVGRNRAAAEDLVHDTFVRVALRKPDLATIGNLDGYLFVTMRNVHLSQLRRQVTRSLDLASPLDYESVAASLTAVDTQQSRQAAYEELRLIARYACIRKPTSKAASALIFRFFHGYYPAEIAQVLHTTGAAVDVRLRIARAEAHAFIADPGRLRSVDESRDRIPFAGQILDDASCVASLRQSIFDARTDDCPLPLHLDRLYSGDATDPIDAVTLSHIVSCAACLDWLNKRLGLPLLAERDPSDMLGRGGRSGPKNGASGAGGNLKTKLRTRLKDVLDDRPRQLRIAVNGLFVGSQAVSGPLSEQRVKILVTERVGFIEIFSEYGVCLLYLDVSSPPDGPAEQVARVVLSEGRHLTATLTFREEAPVLDVVYHDPGLTSALSPARLVTAADDRGEPRSTAGHPASFWRRIRRVFGRGWPAAATAALLILVAALWAWGSWGGTTVTAAEVLRGALAAESIHVAPGTATHRVLTVEERLRSTSKVLRRQRIEVWHDATRGIKVRRLFNEQSQVITGLWTAADGTRTVYRPGQPPLVEAASMPAAPLTSRNIWMHEPSAGDFVALVGAHHDAAAVDDRSTDYVVRYQPSSLPGTGVVEATLTVAKSDHHATAESVVLIEAGEAHEFTFSETGLERLPIEKVRPGVFDLEPILLGDIAPPPAPVKTPAAVVPAPPVAVVPDPDHRDQLELDATYRLYRARLWLGQHAEIGRTRDGIRVTTTVPSEDGQANLNRSFEELLRNPLVALDVSVAAVPADASGIPPGSQGAMPGYSTLVSFFGPAQTTAAREESIRAFAAGIVDRVTLRQERLTALKTLIDRWPDDRLRDLSLESVVTWQLMVQEHADAVCQQTELLRARLAPLFKTSGLAAVRDSDTPASLSTVAEASDAATQLVALSAYQDDGLRGTFLPCSSGSCPALDADRMMQSFAALEAVASRFVRFDLKLGRRTER